MAKEEKLRYIIEALWKGGQAVVQATTGFTSVGKAAKGLQDDLKGLGTSWMDLATPINQTLEVFEKVGQTVGRAWAALKEGADIERLGGQFDRLAASIGATSDSLLSTMQEATSGFLTQAEMMQSGTDIIRLGLADTEDSVGRLAGLVAKLGWDMQTVIMTFANDSKMRLDALGLSVTDVEERMKKYTDAGMDASEAFDLAVMEAGEAQLLLIGDAAETTAGKMRILEASLRDVREGFLAAFSAGFMSNLDKQLEGISANFGLTTAEFGRFMGFLLSPEPQRAIEFLESLNSDAAGADKNMLRLARSTQETAQAIVDAQTAATRASGLRGGLLGNLFGDPGESLADLRARMDVINEPMRQMIAMRDQLAREATTGRRQEFGGFLNIDTAGMSEALQVMLDVASRAGTASEQLYDAAGGGQAVGDAMIEAAGKARAAQLGEAMAAGLITGKQAAEDLQAFINSLTLEDVFAMDEPIAGVLKETDKQEMLRVVEGITTEVATAVKTAAEPAKTETDLLKEALAEINELKVKPEVDDSSIKTADEGAHKLRRYWIEELDGTRATMFLDIVTSGEFPEGAPPPPGRASGGPVSPGRVYTVGEKGPELFVPNMAGQIVPGEAPRPGGWGSMGGPVIVNQNFNGLGIGGALAVARGALARYTMGAR